MTQHMSQLEADSTVELMGDGRYGAHVGDSWNIGDNPNGGYLLAIVLAALKAETGLSDPLSVTAHYLRPGLPDAPAEIDVDVVRTGRTLSSARAVLRQGGKERVLVTVALGQLGAQTADEPYSLAIAPPAIPAPKECLDRRELMQGVELAILSRLDVRIHPEDAEVDLEGPALMRGWIRLRDGSAPSSHALIVFADAFPPSVFSRFGQVGWVPTIELTAHARALAAPGWVQAEFAVDDLSNGRLIETGTLWDSTGNVVVRSRQLGLMRLR